MTVLAAFALKLILISAVVPMAYLVLQTGCKLIHILRRTYR